MKKNILALIDVNNFYFSCEKAFSGALQSKPTIVLSNNDGCVVARSNDVKQWIKMGQPVFEVEDSIKEHDIQVFSSNYTLYATHVRSNDACLIPVLPYLRGLLN